jgi:hypothetical protein
MMSRFRKRGIVAVLGVVTAILVCSALPAKANVGIGGFTVLGAYEGQGAHSCQVIGTAHRGYEAVICVDIQAGAGSNNYWAQGKLEVICQTTAGVEVKCPYVQEAYGVFADGTGNVQAYGDWDCSSSCSSGRNIITEGTIGYNYSNAETNCWQNANSGWNVWTVAYGGNVGVELPVSGDMVYLASDFETGHYYVCPHSYDGEA